MLVGDEVEEVSGFLFVFFFLLAFLGFLFSCFLTFFQRRGFKPTESWKGKGKVTNRRLSGRRLVVNLSFSSNSRLGNATSGRQAMNVFN